MELESEVVQAASRLIAFALMPARRPSNDVEYQRLVERFELEPFLERIARDVARGLGLRILDVSELGVVIATDGDSPFGLTVADYRAGLQAEERLLHGIVQVGLAAFFYPRAEDLESDAIPALVSVAELDAFLRDVCGRLGTTVRTEDPPADEPEIERAFRIYLRWPSTKETTDGRRANKSTTGIAAHALETLADQGLLVRVGDSYRATHRYRVQVRELAAHEALRALRAAAARPASEVA
jgi:hypothetical protein